MILQRCTHPHPCYDDGKCHYKGECGHKAPLTNADRIRSMPDEELAKAIFNWFFMKEHCDMCVPEMRTPKKCNGRCTSGILRWLQQPAEEDDHA